MSRMDRRARLACFTALCALAQACGGGESELTCELLEDPGNCWAEAAAAAAACLPPSTQVGALAADRASCDFGGGTRVVFDAPLPLDTLELDRLGFSIEAGGATCARFVDTFENRMELEAGELSAVSELHPGGDFHLHCGDGRSYESDFDLLFTCTPGVGPTDGFEVGPDRVTFRIVSIATPDRLFECAAGGGSQ